MNYPIRARHVRSGRLYALRPYEIPEGDRYLNRPEWVGGVTVYQGQPINPRTGKPWQAAGLFDPSDFEILGS
jgi:hypothetical protein